MIASLNIVTKTFAKIAKTFAKIAGDDYCNKKKLVLILHLKAKYAKMDYKNEIYAKNWIKRTWTRNGNGLGLGRVFSYSNPTRGPDLGHLLNRFFFRGLEPPPPPRRALFRPNRFRPIRGPTEEKKKEKRIES